MASWGEAFAFIILCFTVELTRQGTAEPLLPAMFVFGDSMVDVGNNNFIEKCDIGCKANYPHFGIDYPDHAPTGRFSNGYNMADQLAQLLHFDGSPPPFLSLSNASLITRMSTGINFASGGSGLLDVTGNGQVCTQVFSLTEQVGNFTNLARMVGCDDLISRSLIFISTGNNDLFECTDFSDHKCHHNYTEFLQSLVASYTEFVKDLYGVGAKKFSVVSPSLVGCCPLQRKIAHDPKNPRVDEHGCFATANDLSRRLYPMIASMLHDLSLELPGMNYSLVDSIKMVEWLFNNTATASYNFTVLDYACCGGGPFGADGCNSSAPLCQNRSNHLFWDDYHPTEAATGVAARMMFGDTTGLFVHPINVQQLVEL